MHAALAEMGITVLTAGARKEGAALAASLPPEIESSTNYEIALSGDGADNNGARQFFEYPAGDQARAIFAANGVE